ncbi:hypothetical protein [Pontibacter vulgaris]|uniref:hypothetical protein n=1 Tax=Pontibacter vulgaris TaxID=2905679 RepID=UPI001FA7C2B0|nr:hypothetical protein [Pontibacter vulgaris]
METSKKSIETVYSYQNGNAKFTITLTMHTSVTNGFDFIVQREELGDVIEDIIMNLSEPVACLPISFDILVHSSVKGTQKLFTTPYRATLEVSELSFPDSNIPFQVLTYPEFELSERKTIQSFRNFRY